MSTRVDRKVSVRQPRFSEQSLLKKPDRPVRFSEPGFKQESDGPQKKHRNFEPVFEHISSSLPDISTRSNLATSLDITRGNFRNAAASLDVRPRTTPNMSTIAQGNVPRFSSSNNWIGKPGLKDKSESAASLKKRKEKYSQQVQADAMAQKKDIWYQDKTGKKRCTTMAHLRKLHKFFRKLDTDGSGDIDMAEVEDYISRTYSTDSPALTLATVFELPTEKLASTLAKIEELAKNQTPITLEKFMELAHPLAPTRAVLMITKAIQDEWDAQKAPSRHEEEEVQSKSKHVKKQTAWVNSMWVRWDADGSGELDALELKTVLQEIGASVEEADKYFREIDKDGSGFISKEEFLEWWLEKDAVTVEDMLRG